MNAIAHKTVDAKPLTRLEAHQARVSHAACGRYWAIIQTHPQAETWACSNLRRAGFDVYLPTLFISRRDRHTPTIIHRVERPLFTSYAFVQLDSTDPWTPIRYTSGVRQILMSGAKPHHTPQSLIDALRAGDALRRVPTTNQIVYRPGAPVKCLYGPFQNHEAVIVSVSTVTARIALPMLGAIREITVPIQSIAVRD